MIFIDTTAFIAKYLTNDQYHDSAINKWQKIEKVRDKCITSNFVLDETFTLLGRWVTYEYAAQKASIIYSSNAIEIIRPTRDDELKAIEYLQKFAKHKVSYTDCISFVLMKKLRAKKVFTFDRHFAFAGFTLI